MYIYNFHSQCSLYCKTSKVVEPMVILYSHLLSISLWEDTSPSLQLPHLLLIHSVVRTAVGQVVTATDILRLFCLDCLQFGTVCDTMSQASTVGAANLACNKHIPKLTIITTNKSKITTREILPIKMTYFFVSCHDNLPPMSRYFSFSDCMLAKNGGIFCFASLSKCFKSSNIDSSATEKKHC